MQSRHRWQWILLALAPGLTSDIMFCAWTISDNARSDTVVALGAGLLCAALLLPFVAPVYLVELGRRYVKAAHGGYQSVTPFVAMAAAVNFLFWLGGVLLALAHIGYR